MKQLFFVLILLLNFGLPVSAQSNTFEWKNSTRVRNNESYFSGAQNDQFGNSYFFTSFSSFADTIRIATVNGSETIVTDESTILLQKIDSLGSTIWIKKMEITGLNATSVDLKGSVFIIGNKKNEGRSTQYHLTKMDPDGNILLEKDIFQPIPHMFRNEIRQMKIGSDGSIYLIGGAVNDFSTEKVNYNIDQLKSNSKSGLFILKLDEKGSPIWFKDFKGAKQEYAFSCDIDVSNNLYVTGHFSNELKLKDITYMADGNTDIFIYKISPEGEDLLFKTIGGRYSDHGNSISIDRNQNIFISGSFEDTIDFDLGQGKAIYMAKGMSDAFFLKLDPKGNFLWVNTVGINGTRTGGSTVRAFNDNVIWTGEFKGEFDFNPDKTVFKLNSGGETNRWRQANFVQINKTNGDFENAFVLNAQDKERINQISFLPNDKLLIGSEVYIYEGKRMHHKLFELTQYQMSNTKSNSSVTSCGPYFWNLSGETYSKSGIYSAEVKEKGKKKVTVELNLTIFEMNKEIKYNGETIKATEKNANYQWLECSQGCKPIKGAIYDQLSPSKTGEYCLILSSTMCKMIDTTESIKIEIKEVDPETLEKYYQVNYDVLIDDIEKYHFQLDGEKVKMIPFRVDQFYGFVENGNPENWIVQPKFSEVFAVYENCAIVKDSTTKGYGIINNQGEYILPPNFNQILKEGELFHALRAHLTDRSSRLPSNYNRINFHAYLDAFGKVIFTEKSHDHEGFASEDLAWFRFGTNYHIRNKLGQIVDSFEGNNEREFLGIADSKLLFRIASENEHIDNIEAVDVNGKVDFIFPMNTYYKVFKINANMFGLLTTDHNYYFYDSLGNDLPYSSETGFIGFMDSDPQFFKEDYFIVRDRNGESMGIIDRSGKVVVPFKYQSISPMINEYWTCIDEKLIASYIDSTGKIIFTDPFRIIQSTGRTRPYMLTDYKAFYDGLSLGWSFRQVLDTLPNGGFDVIDVSNYFYYDIQGDVKFNLDTSIVLAGNFSNGLAPAVNSKRALGFIDKSGKWQIQPLYELVFAGSYPIPYVVTPEFKGGYAYIKSHKGYIDKSGKEYFKGKRMQDHYDFSH